MALMTQFFLHPGICKSTLGYVDIDVEKMQRDLKSKAHLMPENKTEEELREWMKAKRLERRAMRMKSVT